jgi:hypothetical protein
VKKLREFVGREEKVDNFDSTSTTKSRRKVKRLKFKLDSDLLFSTRQYSVRQIVIPYYASLMVPREFQATRCTSRTLRGKSFFRNRPYRQQIPRTHVTYPRDESGAILWLRLCGCARSFQLNLIFPDFRVLTNVCNSRQRRILLFFPSLCQIHRYRYFPCHAISPSMGRIAATTAYNLPRLPAVDGLVATSHVTETSFALSFETYRLLWLLAQSPP